MTEITYAKISPDSTASSAVAVVQTNATKGLCIIVVLSTYKVGPLPQTTLYVSVELSSGNVEQTIAFKKHPTDCRLSLDALIRAPVFQTALLEKLVAKIQEMQAQH